GFAFVGPYLSLDVHFAIGNFIRDGIRGGPIRVKGDGTPYRSYLYAADLAIWLWTILFQGVSCRPYNVGSDKNISIRDLAAVLTDAFGEELDVLIEEPTILGRPAERYVPATSRAIIELRLKENIALSQAIRRTIDWNLQLRWRKSVLEREI
ncbi:MAG: NAD(P)-dependent oxidoreductase, partial [Deltaproteobacteria bacterium]|nr:NAD(P)-dependent oxidoreductase [Deltaproteobacteria bacterium]